MNEHERQLLADEIAKVKLTTYTYNDPSLGTDKHLGFIIEDNRSSPAVYPNQRRVDLYGYTSMAVAALQAQAREIDGLRHEVKALRRALRRHRSAPPG